MMRPIRLRLSSRHACFRPFQAVAWAAFFNFIGGFCASGAVAKTVGDGMVDLSVVTFAVIFAGLLVRSCGI